MNINEMHTAIRFGVDKGTALTLPAFEPEELDLVINNEIGKFIKTRAFGVNVKGESFEQTQKRMDDLRTLVEETVISSPGLGASSDKPNSYIVDLFSAIPDYWFRVGEEVEISYTNSVTNTTINKRQPVTECTADTYNVYMDNPFSEHKLYLGEAKPLRLFRGDFIELITDGNYSIRKYYLRYIRKPATVNILTTPQVNCDLPEHTHQEIVDMCIASLLENIESNRYQSFKSETVGAE